MMLFVGWGIFSFIIPPLADKYGRKKIQIYNIMLNVFVFMVPLMLPGAKFEYVYILIAIMFITGIQCAIKTAVSFNYMMENVPKKHQTLMATIWMAIDASTYIWMTLIYRYISNNWVWIFVIGLV